MKLWIHPKRRDGKIPVTYSFDNGVRIKKLLTQEKLDEEKPKAQDDVEYVWK